MQYIGRFAPSPTGPLHFGSLVAALASYLEAKTKEGKWLVRMEDLDKPREIPGAADGILRTLDAFGFEWDDEVLYQSQRSAAYADALHQLKEKNLIYPCTCTRKEIADSTNRFGIDGIVYPRTCLLQPIKPNTPCAWRIKAENRVLCFHDAIQGEITQHLSTDVGDFILKRADGLFAYQLAVVVDDAGQGITHVVRGADLLNSTPRQIYLQQLLGYLAPEYFHVPIACNIMGEKLSKQTLAQPLNPSQAATEIYHALRFLGQNPPSEVSSDIRDIWAWANTHWLPHLIPRNNPSYQA